MEPGTQRKQRVKPWPKEQYEEEPQKRGIKQSKTTARIIAAARKSNTMKKNTIKVLKIIALIYAIFIVTVNIITYSFTGFGMGGKLYEEGIIILGPTDHAYLFVHGVHGSIPPDNKTKEICLLNISFIGKNMSIQDFDELWKPYNVDDWELDYKIGINSVNILNHTVDPAMKWWTLG